MRGARPTTASTNEDGDRLMPLSHVADALGVPRSTAHTWAAARELSGFPEPARTGAVVTGHGKADLYDFDAVRVWHLFEHIPNQRGKQKRVRSDDPDRGSPAAVGRLLGVATKTVCRWIERRASIGCPQPGEDGLYSLAEWTAWHDAWQHRPCVAGARNRARAAA